ncbi:ankyrin repeat domain-containing protein [Aliarcobacter butzleri]|uniref:ankyrin repeat domain-containing protein n=1 Tax=Aliarcobacter butzleri TaxID=28197 RepID=UPI002B2454E1|nr:ankyrin repeat domain-containing protein [Aliarcobacter butzleri]
MLNILTNKSKFTEQDLVKELIDPTTSSEQLNKIYQNSNIDLNKIYHHDEPILHTCCKKDLYESVLWLLEHNINTEIETEQKETAIFYAIYSKDSKMLKTLVDFNANVNHINNKNRTALQESISNSNNKVIRYLLQVTKVLNNKDTNGNNLIFDAITNGNFNLIKNIVSLKRIDINEINNQGNCVLHLENVLKNNEIAMFLLESGANPTIVDRNEKSFLFYSVLNGIKNMNLIKRASFFGFDLNLKNKDNRNILMEATNHFLKLPKNDKKIVNSQAELIKELVQMNINIQAVDNDNETVFFNITRSEDRDLIHYFLNNGLNINLNKQNNIGLTPLTILVLNGIKNSDLIKLYLEKGASLNTKNKFGKTTIEILINIILHQDNKVEIEPEYKLLLVEDAQYKDILELFIKNYDVEINELNSEGEPLFFSSLLNFNFSLFKILRTRNTDLNKKDENGNNIIFRLMDLSSEHKIKNKRTYLNTIKNLINVGVDVDETNQEGSTALQVAIFNNCKDTVKLLLELRASCNLVDEKGRTLIHSCVFQDRTSFIKDIHQSNQEIINIADSFGARPINYAAFMGKKDLVLEMLSMGALINNPHNKSPKILSFLEKYHKNILNLTIGVKDESNKANLNLLAQNMIKEFNIKTSV